MIGHDYDFLLADVSMKRDWFQLYRGTRAFLCAKNAPLLNRKRICNLLAPIATHIELEITVKRELGGHPVSFLNSETGKYMVGVEGKARTMSTVSNVLSGQLVPAVDHSQQLSEHGCCRAQTYASAQFPRHIPETGAQIRVSMIKLGAWRIISGLTLGSQQLGYSRPVGGEYLGLPTGRSIKAIEVAFSKSRLVGIRFFLTGKTMSNWCGQALGPGLAWGILPVPKVLDEFSIVVGLDVSPSPASFSRGFSLVETKLTCSVRQFFKVVALWLAKPDDIGHLSANSILGSVPKFSYLWVPRVPAHTNLTVGPVMPCVLPRPFAIIDFDFGGGPDGEFLALLTRMVVHLENDCCPVIGMEFHYLDTVCRFGNDGPLDLVLLLADWRGKG
jgi:hypothetical protein